MHRFFVSPESIADDEVIIQGPDVNHIRMVLRLKAGDRIVVLDGKGHQYQVCLKEVLKDKIRGEVVGRQIFNSESPVKIWMGQALIKGNRFDNLIKKSVELGVHALFPLNTERCVARLAPSESAKKIARWQKISKEASQQSGREAIPEVAPQISGLQEFCEETRDCDLKLVFWEQECQTRIRDIKNEKRVKSIAFIAGPEGGLAATEIEMVKKHGFQTVTLGPRILRADSASLVILAILQNVWGDL